MSITVKIAVFTETWLPKLDSIVSILCLILQRLHERDHQVLMFGPSGGPNEYAEVEIVGVGRPPVPFYPEVRINMPRRSTWERFKLYQPDLVHVVGPFFLTHLLSPSPSGWECPSLPPTTQMFHGITSMTITAPSTSWSRSWDPTSASCK
jgi:hypothetical protein